MANTELSRSQRLDQYIVERHPRLSRGYAVRLIEEGKVRVNDGQQKPGYKIRAHDVITIDFDEQILDAIPHIELPVLYEDEAVIVVNKPTGVISHARGRYWDEPSVASFLRGHVQPEDKAVSEASVRAGIVHRLDRATSGVMICAKDSQTLKYLQRQFGDRTVSKTYIAVVEGHLDPAEAIIDMPIGRNPKKPSTFRVDPNGKSARTQYRVLRSSKTADLVELLPKTGRTHQLRVHLQEAGHSIVGDPLYGGAPAERLLLHAHTLELTLPGGHKRLFSAPLPPEFEAYLNA